VLAGSEATGIASATPIRAGGAESADMSLSDRERAEGFHRTTTMQSRQSQGQLRKSHRLEL